MYLFLLIDYLSIILALYLPLFYWRGAPFPCAAGALLPAQKKRPPYGGLPAVHVSALDEVFGKGNDASDQLLELFAHALRVLAGALAGADLPEVLE